MLSLAAFVSLLVPCLALARGSNQTPAFVKFPVKAVNGPNGFCGTCLKRQDAVPLSNGMTGTMYTIQLSLGTPPQPVVVVVDTGSSDLWVNPTCSAAPNQVDFCNSFPRFDYTASSTVNDTGNSFRLSYGKGSALVEYVTDVVMLGSVVIKNQIFGVNTGSNDIPTGILGLAPWLGGRLPKYPYVLDTMVAQGEINSRAFSLDLRSVDSPDGSIIFGGIDTKKYSGNLEKVAIIPAVSVPGGSDRYWVYLDYIEVTSSTGQSDRVFGTPGSAAGLPVFLDSGGTLTRLPTPIYQAIGESFINAFPDTVLDTPSGYYVVDCSIADSPGSVDFGFGGKRISVAYKDIIWNLGRPELDLCVVGVQPEDDEPVLGDSFLRAAYVVYDQDNRNLHLAQAANCGTELVAIGKGRDAVPSIAGGCGASSISSSPTPSSTTSSVSSTTKPQTTTTPASQPTSSSSLPDTSTPTTVTSTISTSTVYTITSCPPTVTDCPIGSVTTEAVILITTFCPDSTTGSGLTSVTPTTTLSISAPCLNCDLSSSSSLSSPAITGTGSPGQLTSTTLSTKPTTTAVVTAGAQAGYNVGGKCFLPPIIVAGVAVLF